MSWASSLTSYVLVPYLPELGPMFGTAALRVGMAAVYFAGWGRGESVRGAPRRGRVLVCHATPPCAEKRGPHGRSDHLEVAHANSHFGDLQVIESRDGRRRTTSTTS